MEKVAATSNEIDSLVLLDDPFYDLTPGSVVLHVVRHLRKPGQTFIDERIFNSLDEALAFCERTYGVSPDNWQDVLPETATFSYQYAITHTGAPQPILVSDNPGRLLFHVDTESGDEASNFKSYQLNICGDREGLRRLAALFLLAADSEKLDKEYHQHLDEKDDVAGNVNVIIRGPGYLPAISSFLAEKESGERRTRD